MKKWLSVLLCLAIAVGFVSVASASVTFTNFSLKFVTTSTYKTIVSDNTSKAMSSGVDYATMVVSSTTSTKNNLYYSKSGGVFVSRSHYEKTTPGTWFYYNTNLGQSVSVSLVARPDSSILTTIKVTGAFGAG